MYRDALAPNQNKPLPKPWERAPVSAHASRLQGRQIWKKAGLRSRVDQENDSSHVELDSVGARKRVRVVGGKTNIGDAQWLVDSGKETGVGGKRGTDDKPNVAREHEELQFVPRKRTNTNHIITPRKPLRQTTLNIHVQTQASQMEAEDMTDKPTRRKKSVRKSLRNSMAANPSRRMSTSAASQEHATMAEVSLENCGIKEESGKTEPKPIFKDNPQMTVAEKVPEPDLALSASGADIQSAVDIHVAETTLTEDNLAQDESGQSIKSSETALDIFGTLLNDHEAHGQQSRAQSRTIVSSTQEDESNFDQGLGIAPPPHIPFPAIASSTEAEQDPKPRQALKPTETPKKRKAAPMRRGTRRSTRTRVSSVKLEEQPDQGNMTPRAIDLETSTSFSQVAIAADCNPQSLLDTAQHSLEPTEALEVNEESVSGQLVQAEGEAAVTQALALTNLDSKPALKLISESKPDDESIGFGEDAKPRTSREAADVQDGAPNETQEPALDDMTPMEVPQINLEDFDLAPPANDLAQAAISAEPGSPYNSASDESSSVRFSPVVTRTGSPTLSDEQTFDNLEVLGPIFVPADETLSFKLPRNIVEDFPDCITEDPITSELVEAISKNAPTITYDHDDTDMLRNFLTRVKANKAAKAEEKTVPKRKRSLPHSPLQIPLGEVDASASPSQANNDFDISLASNSPTRKRKRNDRAASNRANETDPESNPIRRSGRTRLPVTKSPATAPSFIPVRRLGQEGDATVTLRRSEEKELAALTRVNTRKNKAGALPATEVLLKKAEEKDDPALRQRLLKEVFVEKSQKNKAGTKAKSVAWAIEIAQFQEVGAKKTDIARRVENEKAKVGEEKKGAVRLGVRSKSALGMAINGTPASKRKAKEKSELN